MIARLLALFLLLLVGWSASGLAGDWAHPDTGRRKTEEERRGREPGRDAWGKSREEREIEQRNDNRFPEFNEKLYDAYRRERNGDTVKINPRDGEPYEHQLKLRQLQQGLERDTKTLQDKLNGPGLGRLERDRLIKMRAEMKDKLEESIRETRQTPQEREELDRVIRERMRAGEARKKSQAESAAGK